MKIRHPEKIKNPISPIKKKPKWIRTKIIDTQNYFKTKEIINKKKLHTVCQEASCPNISECWSKKHATFMIMGDTCTRACAFCDVITGKPKKLDSLEPSKIALAVKELNSVAWYLDCGDDDYLYKDSSLLHLAMKKKGVKHEYRVRDGAHTWYYWKESLPKVLRFVSINFHNH